MMKIDIQPIRYYSNLDEEYFFTWALDIDCVERTHSGYLYIEEAKVDEPNLRDLLALLHRYELPASPLAVLCSSENEEWFKNEQAYWYDSVFKNA